MRKGLTEIVFILDRSGSMGGLESDTIGGYNSLIEKQKKEEGEVYVSTVLFDDVCEVLHDRVRLSEIKPMTDRDYTVRGCTALIDAIGGAIHHVPVVMDGFISAVAALCAVRLCPAVRDYILPSHITAEPAGKMLMAELGFAPLLHGEMRLGEGTGAVALFPMLDLAAAVYHDAATFTDIKVEAYKPWAK